MKTALSPALRHLVNETVALFGEVLRQKVGTKSYNRIESLRQTMSSLRGRSAAVEAKTLQKSYRLLEKLSAREQFEVAQAFALMLEVMNVCENAYRSQQIRQRTLRGTLHKSVKPETVIYVLTAHPTEARSAQNINVFHQVLKVLTEVLARPVTELRESDKEILTHLFEVAWNTSMVRSQKPQVRDEAEHIYSTLLREEVLQPLLQARRNLAPIFVRSWVGGDKDGHPGVDENVFQESLQIARRKLIKFANHRLEAVQEMAQGMANKMLQALVTVSKSHLHSLTKMGPGDGQRVKNFKVSLCSLVESYVKSVGSLHPELSELQQLLEIFPGLVVPLEFRESSDVLMSSPTGRGLAIDRMLKRLAQISRGGEARWYACELIISMAESIDHIRAAAHLVKKNFGKICLPIVPLFEQARAMDEATKVLEEMLKDKNLSTALKKHWGNSLEVMLGYSDSSKESGVLASRLKVAETMYAIEALCRRQKIKPLFFQGSGGSTDRGGGTIEEQTSWWSSGALKNYKVTIQGEMVERSLANPEITWGQLEKISYYAGNWKMAQKRKLPQVKEVDDFALKVAHHYQSQVASQSFLKIIEKATPYSFLNLIKIGSRPTKRTKTVSVSGLRAIPWILCWTQTRILFPVWWGVGSAWEECTTQQKTALKRATQSHPLFATYMKALGFTLAKVEMAVWKMYLEQSDLSAQEKENTWNDFLGEYQKTTRCAQAILGDRDFLNWRPWLGESIRLRSPMIHPLNLLQIIAMKNQDADLLRVTVIGVSSGMMTTG